jgi:hypothetical protein
MNQLKKLPKTRHKLLADLGAASALLGSAGFGLGGMEIDRRQSRWEIVEWIVKKTPVQLNPPA